MPKMPTDRLPSHDAYHAGRAAFPGIVLDEARFDACIAERGGPSACEAHASELYLVCACLTGDPRAIGRMDDAYVKELSDVLVRADVPAAIATEVQGMLREQLFLPKDGAPPRLMRYRGSGDLRGWLRVVAVRLALDLLRKQRKETSLPQSMADALPLQADDPELALLKQRYKHEFRAAFEDALTALSPRERNLLRHQLLHDLSIDSIGAIYRVHRATAARWVDAARARLTTEVHARMMARLDAQRGDMESVFRLIQSQMDVSLRRVLKPDEE